MEHKPWPKSKTAAFGLMSQASGTNPLSKTPQTEIDAIASMMDKPKSEKQDSIHSTLNLPPNSPQLINNDIGTNGMGANGMITPSDIKSREINAFMQNYIKQNGSYAPEMLQTSKKKQVIID